MAENGAADSGGEISVDQAVGLIGRERAAERPQRGNGQAQPPPQQGQQQHPYTPPAEEPGEELPIDEMGDVAAAEEQPSDETEGRRDAGDDLPPIEPPRSWTNAEREAFAALPRSQQETIAGRERARDSDRERRLSELAAYHQRVAEVEAAAGRAKAQYDQALPMLLAQFQSGFANEFGDLDTWEAVEKMQRDDPSRFERWRLAREKGEALQEATEHAQAEQQKVFAAQFQHWRSQEQAKFFEKAPEFADSEKAAPHQKAVIRMFNDLGIGVPELRAMSEEGRPISFHDHRFQLMARKAMLYDRAVAAARAKKGHQPNPAPSTLKPGSAPLRGAAATSHKLKALETKFDADPSVDNLVAIMRGRRAG